MNTKELIQDTNEAYNANDSICAKFLTTLKTSPLNAHNLSYSPCLVFENWKNNVLGLTNTEGETEQMKKQLFNGSDNLPNIISGCMYNVSLYTTIKIESTEIRVKARYDAINPTAGYIIGLNLTFDASPHGFSNQSAKDNLHIESAFMMHLASMVFNKSFKFFYLVQEKQSPFNHAKYKVSENMRIKGEFEIVDLLAAAATIKQTNLKPSYELYSSSDNGVIDLDLPDTYKPLKIHHL